MKPGGFTMGHVARLQLVGRVTYYLGWISLVCGGFSHVNVARGIFTALDLTQRNLFEVSVVSFLICIASELRARDTVESEVSHTVKHQVAA
jgi:hypothetical protein